MHTADSETLINFEVELCKCLAELETADQSLRSDSALNESAKRDYSNAKTTAEWIANELRERLEPWRQLMDLYTSIEKSHKAVSELLSQMGSKQESNHQETCKDIEILDVSSLKL
jgi:hypothetical protein